MQRVPYKLDDFKRLGLYVEKTGNEECSFEGGKVVVHPEVNERIKDLLKTPGGDSHKGNKSSQDMAVMTALLYAGYNPADTYATFDASPRGVDARERKPNPQDYLERTIERAVAFVTANPRSDSHVSVNFAMERKRDTSAGLIVSMGNEVETEKTQWIWPGYIPAGKLTLLAGDPGMGKSTMVGDLIARISKGTFLPSGQRSITGTSLIASAEDSPEDTIIPRLIACEANLKRVGVIREVRDDEGPKGESRYLSFPRDLGILRQTLVAKGCRLLIIDPLNAFLDKGTDSYKDQDIRRVLHPLEMMAEETGTAILIVAHLNKKEDAGTLYRIGGSIGFIGAARSVLAVTKLPDETRVLYSLKSNLSARPASMAYEIKQVRKTRTSNNTWLGEESIHSSGVRWLGEVDFNPFSKNPTALPETRVSEEATDFLRQVLTESGESDTENIYAEAKVAGISRSHLNRVRSSIGIVQTRRNGKWFWALPEE